MVAASLNAGRIRETSHKLVWFILTGELSMSLNIAIAGCGLIGHKRAASLGACRLAICCDVDASRARALAAAHPGAEAATDWRLAVSSPGVDMVIVATTHD